MDKAVSWIAGLFLLVGIGLLALSAYLVVDVKRFLRTAVETEGVVIQLVARSSSDGTTYAPMVRYRLSSGDVRSFISDTSSAPPAYRVGERIAVLYDPGDTGEGRIRGFFSLWGLASIFGGMGAVFTATSGGIFGVRRARKMRALELRRRGRPVQAWFQSVERNTSLSVNGLNPWRIVCQWVDPRGELHVFRSENLWFDPTPYVRRQEITVFVDPRNAKRYAMDVSFLPKLAA